MTPDLKRLVGMVRSTNIIALNRTIEAITSTRGGRGYGVAATQIAGVSERIVRAVREVRLCL